ncbi:MAG: hypothetical protein C0401_04630 [Anaerolinea sp.]|nr:hypothetical protein [Anaerolinea sp.]
MYADDLLVRQILLACESQSRHADAFVLPGFKSATIDIDPHLSGREFYFYFALDIARPYAVQIHPCTSRTRDPTVADLGLLPFLKNCLAAAFVNFFRIGFAFAIDGKGTGNRII